MRVAMGVDTGKGRHEAAADDPLADKMLVQLGFAVDRAVRELPGATGTRGGPGGDWAGGDRSLSPDIGGVPGRSWLPSGAPEPLAGGEFATLWGATQGGKTGGGFGRTTPQLGPAPAGSYRPRVRGFLPRRMPSTSTAAATVRT
jgi:hypothetical protein